MKLAEFDLFESDRDFYQQAKQIISEIAQDFSNFDVYQDKFALSIGIAKLLKNSEKKLKTFLRSNGIPIQVEFIPNFNASREFIGGQYQRGRISIIVNFAGLLEVDELAHEIRTTLYHELIHHLDHVVHKRKKFIDLITFKKNSSPKNLTKYTHADLESMSRGGIGTDDDVTFAWHKYISSPTEINAHAFNMAMDLLDEANGDINEASSILSNLARLSLKNMKDMKEAYKEGISYLDYMKSINRPKMGGKLDSMLDKLESYLFLSWFHDKTLFANFIDRVHNYVVGEDRFDNDLWRRKFKIAIDRFLDFLKGNS